MLVLFVSLVSGMNPLLHGSVVFGCVAKGRFSVGGVLTPTRPQREGGHLCRWRKPSPRGRLVLFVSLVSGMNPLLQINGVVAWVKRSVMRGVLVLWEGLSP
jgi:hypothetical protein